MAWKLRTTCQQCSKKLSKKDRALGPVCSPCVERNKTIIYGNDAEEDYDGE